MRFNTKKEENKMPLSNVITKYEKARIIGTRAIQISMNAPPTIDPKGETDSLKIAEMEYEQKKIPFSIIRNFPNGSTETIKFQDLQNV